MGNITGFLNEPQQADFTLIINDENIGTPKTVRTNNVALRSAGTREAWKRWLGPEHQANHYQIACVQGSQHPAYIGHLPPPS
jgi:hypothetical protein